MICRCSSSLYAPTALQGLLIDIIVFSFRNQSPGGQIRITYNTIILRTRSCNCHIKSSVFFCILYFHSFHCNSLQMVSFVYARPEPRLYDVYYNKTVIRKYFHIVIFPRGVRFELVLACIYAPQNDVYYLLRVRSFITLIKRIIYKI